MAKTILENRFILTKKLHAEYCKESFKKTRKRTKILCFVLAFLSLVAAALIAGFLKSEKFTLLCLVLMVYFVVFAFCGYKFSEWINYRGMLKEHNTSAIVMLITFTPVQIKVQVNNTSFAFKYSTIDRIMETENLYILLLKAEGMIEHGQVIFKSGFKGGSSEDFIKLINEKTGKELLALPTNQNL